MQSGTPGEKGDLTIRYMKPGKYVLKQTKAPLGYVLQVKEYPFEITRRGQGHGRYQARQCPHAGRYLEA